MSTIHQQMTTTSLRIRFLPALLGLACLTGTPAEAAEEALLGPVEHPAIHHGVIEPAGADMPRADTAAVAELGDGRLMVVYHKYEPGKDSGRDHGSCRIWSKDSRDGGRTWANPRMLVDVEPGDLNVQAPALVKLDSGELLLICLRAHSRSSSTMCQFRSTDGGSTFIAEPNVWTRSQGQWLQGGASSLVKLESGRLILPLHGGTGSQSKQKNDAWCYLSDDDGHTWRRSTGEITLPMRGAMEASIAELPDGLVMSLRTQLGGPYLSRSTDEGETWSEAVPSGLTSGESCTCLRRIPGTNDLLLLFNNSRFIPRDHHHYGERTPLSVAVSSDAGRTWRLVGNLAQAIGEEYTNLDCTFTASGTAVITFMRAAPAWNRDRISLRVAVVDKGWFSSE